MRNFQTGPRRMLATVVVATVATLGLVAIAMAAGGASESRAGRIKVKCPTRVLRGKTVTCRVFGRLVRGPEGPRGSQGPKGPKGAKGERGEKGDRGVPGTAGISGYEVVSQTFKEVFVQNSGGMRGLSEVKTLDCPGGKRVLSGGADLGTNAAQNGQQRQVTVSLSGPTGTGSGWSVQLFNNSTSLDTSIDVEVFAVCASVG
jgi:hypothetical protein